MQLNILPTIHRPTRVDDKSQTIIDNIFSNLIETTNFESGIFKADITDHFPNFLIIKNTKKNILNRKETIYKRNLKIKNLEKLKNKCGETNWENVTSCNNAENAFELFSEKLQNIFNSTCPIEEKTLKNKEVKNPWMTEGLKKSSKRKQKLYNKFLKNRTEHNKTNYKTYKQLFERLIRRSKRLYYTNKTLKFFFA